MKLFCYILLTSQLFLFCTASNAQIPSTSIKFGAEVYNAKDEYPLDIAQVFNASFAGEIMLKQFDSLPTLPEIGLGAEYLIPQKDLLHTSSFLPFYGIASFKIHSQKDLTVTKLILKSGYNWFWREKGDFRNSECLPYTYMYTENYCGGMYYGIGIDHIILEKIVVGIHFSKHNAKNYLKPNPKYDGISPKTVHIKYQKISFVIGYVFK